MLFDYISDSHRFQVFWVWNLNYQIGFSKFGHPNILWFGHKSAQNCGVSKTLKFCNRNSSFQNLAVASFGTHFILIWALKHICTLNWIWLWDMQIWKQTVVVFFFWCFPGLKLDHQVYDCHHTFGLSKIWPFHRFLLIWIFVTCTLYRFCFEISQLFLVTSTLLSCLGVKHFVCTLCCFYFDILGIAKFSKFAPSQMFFALDLVVSYSNLKFGLTTSFIWVTRSTFCDTFVFKYVFLACSSTINEGQ